MIIKKLAKNQEIIHDNILFFGSSGGGFVSIGLATLVKGSKCLVNNTQFDVMNYYNWAINNLFEILEIEFNNLNREEIINRISYRLDLVELFKKNDYMPNITYYVNVLSKTDIYNHCIPFLNKILKISSFNDKLDIHFYHEYRDNAHDPMYNSRTLYVLKNFIKNNLNNTSYLYLNDLVFKIPSNYTICNQQKVIWNNHSEIYFKFEGNNYIIDVVNDYCTYLKNTGKSSVSSIIRVNNMDIYKVEVSNSLIIHYWFVKENNLYHIFTYRSFENIDELIKLLVSSIEGTNISNTFNKIDNIDLLNKEIEKLNYEINQKNQDILSLENKIKNINNIFSSNEYISSLNQEKFNSNFKYNLSIDDSHIINGAEYKLFDKCIKITPRNHLNNIRYEFNTFEKFKSYKLSIYILNKYSDDLNFCFSANSKERILVRDSIKLNKNEDWVKVELILTIPYNAFVLYLDIIELSDDLNSYYIKKAFFLEEINVDFIKSVETDFIMSLGATCKPANFLRTYGLSYVSSPLDWMRDYDLETSRYLIDSNFKDYFEEIEFLNQYCSFNRKVLDKKNNVLSIHFFNKNNDLEEEKIKFRSKMIRRGLRIKDYILNSDNLVFISHREDSRENFYKFMESFYKKYNKKLTYINIRHSNNINFDVFTHSINKDLMFIEYLFHDFHPRGYPNAEINSWKGNEKYWGLILNSIKLSNKFINYEFDDKKYLDEINKINKYKISIIIPVYNVEDFIERCISSLFNQTISFENLEIIFVDNCSMDKSLDIIKSYSNQYENIKYFKLKENTNFNGKLYNVGLEHATASYVLFLDPKNIVLSDACELLYEKITHEKVDIVSGVHSDRVIDGEYKIPHNLLNNILTDINQDNYTRENLLKERLNIGTEEYGFTQIKLDSINDLPSMLCDFGLSSKLFDIKFLNDNHIKFPENIIFEDYVFLFNTFINAKGIIFLNKIIYNYIKNEDDKILSLQYDVKTNIKILKTYNLMLDISRRYNKEYEFIYYILRNELNNLLNGIINTNLSKEDINLLLSNSNLLFKEVFESDIINISSNLKLIYEYVTNEDYENIINYILNLNDDEVCSLIKDLDKSIISLRNLENINIGSLKQLNSLKNEINEKNNKLIILQNEISDLKAKLKISEVQLEFKSSRLELLKSKYNAQSSKLSNKEHCINCYEEEIQNNTTEVQYLKKSDKLSKKLLIPLTYAYLIGKSNPKEIRTNIKLYRALKSSESFDIGYYLNTYPDIAKSKWCKYFSPELHYVCNGFDEARKFNKKFQDPKYFNKKSKKDIIEDVKTR